MLQNIFKYNINTIIALKSLFIVKTFGQIVRLSHSHRRHILLPKNNILKCFECTSLILSNVLVVAATFDPCNGNLISVQGG